MGVVCFDSSAYTHWINQHVEYYLNPIEFISWMQSFVFCNAALTTVANAAVVTAPTLLGSRRSFVLYLFFIIRKGGR